MYSYRNPDGNFIVNLDRSVNFYGRSASSNTGVATDFFWGGGFDLTGVPFATNGYIAGNDDLIDVHTEHPYVKSYAAYRSNYILQTGDSLGGVNATLPAAPGVAVDCTSSSTTVGAGTADVLFRQSKFIPLQSDESYGKQQSIYLNENAVDLNALGLTEPVTFNDANNTVLAASPSLVAISNLSNDVLNPDLTNNGNGYERNVKTAFDSFDQYLLGKQSCGSYLFVSTDTHQNIQVDGDSVQSEEVVQFGQQNSINIPLVFQYRMTDYFGTGAGSSGGIGNIAGDSTGATVNVTYTKKLGFDLYPNNQRVFQYDIEVFAKYRSDNLNIDVFPSQTVTKGLNDLEKVVAGLNPSVNQTRVSRIQLANVNGGAGPIG